MFCGGRLVLDWKYSSLGTMGLRVGSVDDVHVKAGIFNGASQFAHGVVEPGGGKKSLTCLLEASFVLSNVWNPATTLLNRAIYYERSHWAYPVPAP
ncbi:MAG TPA: hypothetical protein DGH68_13215 [Bacteroidetes bacterium]|jgi:hypothetical protein|nr:hypothetical protein [Bacteroidota bacterium]